MSEMYDIPQVLGSTAFGAPVYLTHESSHALTHIAHHPKLLEAVKKHIPLITDDSDMVRVEMDAGETIGTTDLVTTEPDDEIVYAKRVARSTYSRLVKHQTATPTSRFVLDIRKDRNRPNSYFLYTAFVGTLTPSFPGGNFLPEQSKSFWANHALVYGTQEITPGTETTDCPW